MSRYDTVRLSHGAGGQLTLELIEGLFVAAFGTAPLKELADAAVLENPGGRLAFATDAHTVKPAFFPGGDIGRLAVAGTVNDLAVVGARPLYLSAAFLLEEGYPLAELKRIVRSMQRTAEEAGVTIVAGDTKVLGPGRPRARFAPGSSRRASFPPCTSITRSRASSSTSKRTTPFAPKRRSTIPTTSRLVGLYAICPRCGRSASPPTDGSCTSNI